MPRHAPYLRLGLGAILLAILLLIALAAPLLLAADPNATDLRQALASPSWQHPIGTDIYGRDLLARLIWGARQSLGLALGATMLALLAGSALGVLAGFGPRPQLLLLGALIDLLATLPGFVWAMALVAVLGSDLPVLILALGLAYLPRVALITRTATLTTAAAAHIEAARALGVSAAGIVWRSILPAILPVSCVVAGTIMGNCLLAEAGLSFLGIGVQPPAPTWGAMIAEGADLFQAHPWQAIVPGLAIAWAVAAVNLLGDGLHDWLERGRA